VRAVEQMKSSDFLEMRGHELREAFAAGHPVDIDALADTEYRGVSLGLPTFIERLSWKKFKKAFCRDDQRGGVRGWNVRLQQNELDGPSMPKLRHGQPFTFGHFAVVDATGRKMPVPGAPTVLLDYGQGENAWSDVNRFVRDPLVAVNAGDMQLLLGNMYFEVGLLRIPTPSYFTLEYECPLGDRVLPPARKR
jgi:hypothetical protein